eukprot:scaffold409296_cov67-Attheya_sp.AAC.1
MVVSAGLPAEMQFESGGAYVKRQVSHIIKHSMKPDLRTYPGKRPQESQAGSSVGVRFARCRRTTARSRHDVQ